MKENMIFSMVKDFLTRYSLNEYVTIDEYYGAIVLTFADTKATSAMVINWHNLVSLIDTLSEQPAFDTDTDMYEYIQENIEKDIQTRDFIDEFGSVAESHIVRGYLISLEETAERDYDEVYFIMTSDIEQYVNDYNTFRSYKEEEQWQDYEALLELQRDSRYW